jgi:peptidoglycan hydrolase CwlO-like protein
MDSGVIIALITAGATIAASLIAFHAGRAGRVAQNADTLIDLQNQTQKFSNELIEVKKQLDSFNHKNSVLWKYVYALVEQLRTNDIVPVPPPSELETDPKLIALIR